MRPAFVDVDTGYGPSRGNTAVDLRAAAPNAEVAVDVHAAGVVRYIQDHLHDRHNFPEVVASERG
jgi:inosine-uridine nucleoside N-ribohydrolase